ncbi:MAG TPA: efflux RND transporter permease subunit [Nitrospiraceae bacterium]|nr:efflux RND transporter permease subunit [Nitrospiraceae bacterium]
MRLSDISIQRPVLATVMTLLLMLFGLLSYSKLPVRQYPDITFPIISVQTVYPRADAKLIESDVTTIIEEALSGIEGLRTLRSISREGLSYIGLEFALTRNIDAAANDVRDRVASVRHLLPLAIEAPLVMKVDSEADGIMWLALISDRHTELEITDFAERQIKDQLSSLPGVSRVVLEGQRRYAMRIWLHPDRLASRGLTVQDVEDALLTQNVSIPGGRIESTAREFSVRMSGGLVKPEQFNQLILAYRDGYPIRLQDVGTAEIGAEDDRKMVRVNGRPSVGLGIMKQSKANTLAAARAVKGKLLALEDLLPPGMQLITAFDSSIYIEESLHEVYAAVGLSLILVVLVVFVFLRSTRATLIPVVAIPGSVLGTFIIMHATDCSINTITLLGFVLAIGLVVDDAIVVVENVYRRIEQGLGPIQAAAEGSREIGFAVISTTLTLAAVFVPIIFLPGIVGRLFTELGIAVAGSVLLSGFIALTLTPAMCARMLVVRSAGLAEGDATQDASRWPQRIANGYRRSLSAALSARMTVITCAVLSLVISAILMSRLPAELAPLEDKGWFTVHLKAPEGSTLAYTDRYTGQAEELLARIPEMDSYYTVVARGEFQPIVNRAVSYATLKDWSIRNRLQQQIVDEVNHPLVAIPGVSAYAINPPSIDVVDDGKDSVQLVIRGPAYEVLDDVVSKIREELFGRPLSVNFATDLDLNKPEVRVDVNRDKAADLGIPVETIGRTLETFLGGRKASTFMREGREYPVIIQTRSQHRSTGSDIEQLQVRGAAGNLIPLNNLVGIHETVAPRQLNHYDKLRSVTITTGIEPGSTLGHSLASLEQVARKHLPAGATISYAGESKEFKESGGTLHLTFVLALLVIYLILAAQFESFRHPVTVLVSVPPALAGALLALTLSQGTMNIYSEIGLMILIGLVTKNAILIVEFANQLGDRGMDLRSAVIEASALRLRPIIMTTAATILAALPLALATGAGAAGRRHIGLVVIGGLVLSTLLTLYFVPVVYSLLAGRTAPLVRRSPDSNLVDQPQSGVGGHERLPVST